MTNDSEPIVLGGGCFWCIEAVYKRIKGITSTRPGYAGGHAENPNYRQVCSGSTGHAEVVEVSYDPAVLSLDTILEIFWKSHDPTARDRQGSDVGTQYRSIILYADETQKITAEASLAQLTASGVHVKAPATQIEALETFWPAEPSHKDYFENNRGQPYCRVVIEPKLHKLALLED